MASLQTFDEYIVEQRRLEEGWKDRILGILGMLHDATGDMWDDGSSKKLGIFTLRKNKKNYVLTTDLDKVIKGFTVKYNIKYSGDARRSDADGIKRDIKREKPDARVNVDREPIDDDSFDFYSSSYYTSDTS